MNAVLRALTTPLLPQDYLALVNPLWSAREVRGRIVAVRPETRDSATLEIRPARGFRFDFAPGQYLGIGVRVEGRWRWRSYSLTSVPSCDARTVTITVKAMPEGLLSGHLVSGVRPGTVVRLAAPQGDFVLPDPPPERMLFLTAGSGITPVMAMLRTLRRRGQVGDIVHLHSAPTRAEVLFAAELGEIARAHPGYRLTVRASGAEGRLDPVRIGDQVPDWRDRHTWACGPAGMLDALEKVWTAAGLGHRLHTERFAAPRTGAVGTGGTVTFARTGRTVRADPATTLLDAGEQAGVLMPFGCRMGICHTCVVTLTGGRAVDLRSGAEHDPGTRIQTCVSAPGGDCVVDI